MRVTYIAGKCNNIAALLHALFQLSIILHKVNYVALYKGGTRYDMCEFKVWNLLGFRLSKEALECLSIYCIIKNIEKPILIDVATFLCSSDAQQGKVLFFY